MPITFKRCLPHLLKSEGLFNLKKEVPMATSEKDTVVNVYQHDLAACDVYKEVISHIEDASIKSTLSGFLADHERHVERLTILLKEEYATQPSERKDLKGTLLSGYTTVRSMTGQEGALKALQTAENSVLKTYQESLPLVTNEKAKDLIRTQLGDEENHSRFIASTLSK